MPLPFFSCLSYDLHQKDSVVVSIFYQCSLLPLVHVCVDISWIFLAFSALMLLVGWPVVVGCWHGYVSTV